MNVSAKHLILPRINKTLVRKRIQQDDGADHGVGGAGFSPLHTIIRNLHDS